MKLSKLFITYILLLSTLTSQAQIAGSVYKQSAKAAVKSAVKTEVKNMVKQGVKNDVKQMVKKNVTKRLARGEAKRMANAVATGSRRETVTTVRNSIKKRTGKAASLRLNNATKVVERKLPTTILRNKTDVLVGYTGRHIVERTVSKALIQKVEKQSLERAIGKRGLETAEKLLGANKKNMELLQADLAEKPAFANAVRLNPDLLHNYSNFIESSYRTDITLLRYAQNNMDKLGSLTQTALRRKNDWVWGKNLLIKEQHGISYMYDGASNKCLGTIEKTSFNHFTINVEDPALLNTYSLANTTYKYNNMTWQTDKYGRVYKWSVTIDNSVVKAGRDSGLIKRINASKSAYDTNNMMVASPNKYNDVGGHIVADSWGGPSVSANIFPQNKLMNNSGVWKMSENQGLKAAKKGNVVTRSGIMTYVDNTTLRPSSCSLTQTVNGAYQTLKDGTTMKDVVVDNIIVRK